MKNFYQMRKLGLLSVFMIFGLLSFGQNNDPKAKAILDKLSETTRSYNTIQIDFSFTLENLQEDIKEINEGSVAMKGNFYRLNMPALGMEVYCDGTTSWTFLPDAEEVSISENDPEDEETLNPANLFTIYEKGFKYKYIGEEKVGNTPTLVIDLFPEDRTKDFSRVRLNIDKAKYQLLKAKTFGKDGNHYTVEMKTLKTDEDLPDQY